MALCLAAAGVALQLAVTSFTLSWNHTIEHLPWREDWRVDGDRLRLETVRIKGSGAGMEPPPEARLEGGWYVWHPMETRAEIVLRRAVGHGEAVGDWQLCAGDEPCAALGALVGATADPVRLYPCP